MQEVVVLVRDEQAAADAPEGYVTYTEPEIEHPPETSRRMHCDKCMRVKRSFGADVITSREAERA